VFKILIADDDRRMRQMLRQFVSGLASEVYEAADGLEAVEVCAAHRPDWVLMDFRMKPGDGLEATAEIRAHYPETRVVMVSQYDDAVVREAALRAGACAYVLKENLQELPGILAKVGTRKSAEAPGLDTEEELKPGSLNPKTWSER
jgi:CheY-like chemotaxis protein